MYASSNRITLRGKITYEFNKMEGSIIKGSEILVFRNYSNHW